MDEQPLAFLRWAPGLAAAYDEKHRREREREQRKAQQRQDEPPGPRFKGGG